MGFGRAHEIEMELLSLRDVLGQTHVYFLPTFSDVGTVHSTSSLSDKSSGGRGKRPSPVSMPPLPPPPPPQEEEGPPPLPPAPPGRGTAPPSSASACRAGSFGSFGMMMNQYGGMRSQQVQTTVVNNCPCNKCVIRVSVPERRLRPVPVLGAGHVLPSPQRSLRPVLRLLLRQSCAPPPPDAAAPPRSEYFGILLRDRFEVRRFPMYF